VPISLAGTFPVSATNLGLAAAVPALNAKIVKLEADASKLTASLDTQIAVSADFPPNPLAHAPAFATALDVAAVAAALNPTTWVSANADNNLDLTADLATVEAQIAIVDPIVTDLDLGLGATGLVGWTYAGRAAAYGPALTSATASGYGGIAPTATVNALIIATSAFASWETFSEGFETGPTADTDLGERPAASRLTYLGSLSGSDWNTGARAQLKGIQLILSALEGQGIGLEGQIAASLGLNLPDPGVVVDAGLAVDFDAAFGNLATVQTDLTAGIAGITANIDATLALIASIEAQLSVGGLTFWSYSGPAGSLGATFAPEVAGGLPGVDDPSGPCYGLVIACASADDWSAFGQIFKTG
jgi:hypothetical protein